jgi:hypothetical protein
MARNAFGITTSAITWEKEKSQIDIDATGLATISVEGAVNSTGIGLEAALNLIPATIPASSTGPLGTTSTYTGAKISTKSAFWEGGTWQVSATYTKGGAQTAEFPDGTDESASDRYTRQIVVVEEPIMTHPVAIAFPIAEKNKLANLIQGRIEPNPDYDPESDSENYEFGALNVDSGEFDVAVNFSTTAVTSGELSASPLDWARLIKAGVLTYQRKTIRHTRETARNAPAPNVEYRRVGTVVDTPQGAPTLADGYEWMLTGIIDSSANNDSWSAVYEFEASGPGGYLGILYEGGSGVIQPA